MRKPTPMTAFDALYKMVAGKGRGEALFGESFDLVRSSYERSLIGDGYPIAYLEFPLLGESSADILAIHTRADIRPGDRFAPGAGFGYQAMLDWFASAPNDSQLSCGIELDTSMGETERAGVYLQFYERRELLEPFLESVGEGARAESYRTVADRMPDGWPPAYVGLFPGRAGTPLRIGGYMGREAHEACAADPSFLAGQFDRIGFAHYDDRMLKRCSELMGFAPSVDFQFDIMPDGSLGDVFGLSLSFNEIRPREARACMETGCGADICGTLEEWGLADDRWKLLADAVFARHVPFTREDGSEGRFVLCCQLNFAKVKFAACEPRPAKFYLLLQAGELNMK